MKSRIRRIAMWSVGIAAAASVTGMFAHRRVHERALDRAWQSLEHAGSGETFRADMVDGVPEPARRWLLHAIAPGTPLAGSAVLRMRGTLALQENAEPWRMRAEQVLAPPHGFVWRAEVESGLMGIRGFDRYVDGRGTMRWWLWGLAPVVTQDGSDVSRSAAGRLAGESTLVPSSLLPLNGVTWEPVSADAARATTQVHGEIVRFTIHVEADGRLARVVIDRWNGDPANGPIGQLPFVVDFEGERVHHGYTLPARMRAGWERDGAVHVFFDAELTDAAFH